MIDEASESPQANQGESDESGHRGSLEDRRDPLLVGAHRLLMPTQAGS